MKKAAFFLAFVACAIARAETVEEIRAEIKSNSVSRGTWCAYYKAWYADLCTEAERSAILERNIAAHRRWIALAPESPAPHAGLGGVYAAVDRWDEAKKELAIALAAPEKLDPKQLVSARWNMANCLWQEGDKAGARRLLDEIVAARKGRHDFWSIESKASYLAMELADRDADLDTFRLPHAEDGRPFPVPQEAEYGEARVPLAKVALNVSGLAADDPILALLRVKLGRFGSVFAPDGTPVEVALAPDAPVDKPQGYSLDIADDRVAIRARTRQGVVWGLVSFVQCVDRKDLSVRTCKIRDWPKCLRRGVIDYWQHDVLEFVLFAKMSSITMRMDSEYSLSPLDRERYRIWSERCSAFGIEVYHGSNRLAMTPILPLAHPRTRELHVSWVRFLASIGMGFSLHLDDNRFPLHPFDLDTAGAGANLDARYITDVYREAKKVSPDFIMQFCPPFYWGPDGPANYPEKREPYLKSLGEFLDPEIDVYWTGPRVKSYSMSTNKVAWYANLIGRKPGVFHNGNCLGTHNHLCFGADPTGFKKSHPKDLFDHISFFQQNMSHYREASMAFSAMDWCWNPEGHDAKVAVRRADELLEGPGVFEPLAEAMPEVSYFDKYGGTPRSELFAEDPDELDRRVAVANDAWTRAMAVAKNGGIFVDGFRLFGLVYARRLASFRRKPPKWLLEKKEAEMANTSFAKDEVGYDEAKGDVFIPAELLMGGMYVRGVDDRTKRKSCNVKYIGIGEEAGGRFSCEPFPPERPFTFIVVGKPWKKNQPEMELEVNGRVVWRGGPFASRGFKPREIEIPVDALARSNKFVLRNVSPADDSDRKAVVHYVVIRRE